MGGIAAAAAAGALNGGADDPAGLTPGAGHPDLPAESPAATVATSPGSATGGTGRPADGSLPLGGARATNPGFLPRDCVAGDGGAVFRLASLDDFDGAAVDTDAWYLYDSEGNAGYGLRRPSAITVGNGSLVITARMEGDALVSGGMAHNLAQTYGRWEFRVRTDPDPSAATSGVVLTWPASGNWPIDGENDIYETETSPTRFPFSTFIHFGADNDQEHLVHAADATQWHEMAMEWTPDAIVIFRDGQRAGRITNPEAIPHVPHHLTVQLDAWADRMGDPVSMEVDWVRVYRYDGGGGGC